jgi:hypothetical protein
MMETFEGDTVLDELGLTEDELIEDECDTVACDDFDL